MDENGSVVIAPKFDVANQFSDGRAIVFMDKKPFVINKQGNVDFPTPYDRIMPFVEGYAIYTVDNKMGVIDTNGAIILPSLYTEISHQGEGKIGLKKDGLWSFYSLDAKRLLNDINYLSIGEFSENRAKVQCQKTRKYGFINELGELTIPCNLEWVTSPFSDGFAAVRDSNNRNCFLNKMGLNQFETYYDNVKRFSEGLAFVREAYDALGYFIDTLGNRNSARSYKTVWWFSEGFCGVETDSSFLVIDKNENTVFSSEKIELRFYADGFGAFCDHSGDQLTWGIMNTKQEIISDRRFTLLVNKTNSLFWEFYFGDPAKWYRSGKRGYINLNGTILWQEE